MKATTLIFTIFLLLTSWNGVACTCAAGVSFEQAVAEADTLVLAKLKTVTDRGEDFKGLERLEGSFLLTQTFKGIIAGEFNITTAATKPACGVNFVEGGSYLLILKGGKRTISNCDHGGLVPQDLQHTLGHEIEEILKDPAAAVANAKAQQAKDNWLKTSGMDIYLSGARLQKCAAQFELDKQQLKRRNASVQKAKKLWFELMKDKLDNPQMMSMLGNIFARQANAEVEKSVQQGKLNEIECQALVLDGKPDEIYRKLQTYQ